jgi:hypothetical protein
MSRDLKNACVLCLMLLTLHCLTKARVSGQSGQADNVCVCLHCVRGRGVDPPTPVLVT